jgi:lipopolysaccharide transport system ATP-binding protein
MYRIYDKPADRLKQMFWRGRRSYGQEFWALHDISFEVNKGEMVGIIGRNGSGKSTLLQIIAGTLAPTEGEVQVKGRVTALLELGSGFNPEFTGRENVFLNGALLGLPPEEVRERFDEIAAFADIGAFIDQPVKLYSSGMMVRLAFAVQACVDPEVLIVDEALTVGDVFFQQKCYRRLETLRERGTSILFVSHALGDVRQFCQRAIVLSHGRSMFQGSAYDAVSFYMLLDQQERTDSRSTTTSKAPAVRRAAHGSSATSSKPAQTASSNGSSLRKDIQIEDFEWPNDQAFLDIAHLPQVSNGWARCTRVAICDEENQPSYLFEQGDVLRLFYEFELLHDIEVPVGGMSIENKQGYVVHGKNALQYTYDMPPRVKAGTILRFRHDVVLDIAVGEYTLEVGLATTDPFAYEQRALLTPQDLYDKTTRICHLNTVGPISVIYRYDATPTQMTFWGMADLPGNYAFEKVDGNEGI